MSEFSMSHCLDWKYVKDRGRFPVFQLWLFLTSTMADVIRIPTNADIGIVIHQWRLSLPVNIIVVAFLFVFHLLPFRIALFARFFLLYLFLLHCWHSVDSKGRISL